MLTFTEWMETMYRPFSGSETPPAAAEAPAEGSQPAAPAEGGEGGSGDGGSAPDPMAPLMERMDAMGQQIQQIAESSSTATPGQAEGGDPSQMPGFAGYDAYGNATYSQPGAFDGIQGGDQLGQPAVPQFNSQQAQQLVQLGLMDPNTGEVNEQAASAFLGMGQQLGQTQQQYQQLTQQIGAMRLELDAGALESKFPELADPEKGEAIVQKAVEQAQMMGNPQLAQNPGFIELVYQAQRAEAAASGETPAAGLQGATLESAGGAGAPAAPATDLGEEIVNAGGQRGGSPFFP